MVPVPSFADRYQLDSTIAEGGMARVSLARQVNRVGSVTDFEKMVVLKTVLPHLVGAKQFAHMFLDEARIAADLRHPNVVQLLDAGHGRDGLYLALELLDGADASRLLRSFRERKERMSMDIALPIIIDAAHGLSYVHEKAGLDGVPLGIVHRDISPSNLFVTLAGVTKVLDFGVAHARNQLTITEVGVLKGKCPYMSPEQVMGDPVDHRSDQFALAVVAVELLSGRRIFERDSDVLTLRAIVQDTDGITDDIDDAAPPPLAQVLKRALSMDRGHRYPTTRSFAEAIEEAGQQAGLSSSRSALRRAVERAGSPMLARTRGTPTAPVSAPQLSAVHLRDVEHDNEQRATALVSMPPALADATRAGQRAPELAEQLWGLVTSPVAPRARLTEAELALCAEASSVARTLMRAGMRSPHALVLAVAAEIANKNDDAALLDDALALVRDAEPTIRARALELAGDRRRDAGDIEGARSRYQDSLALCANDAAFGSLVERNLADLALGERDLVAAESHARRACSLGRQSGSRFSLARSVWTLARIELRRGNVDAAELLLDQAARALEQVGDARFLARVNFERGLVCAARGDGELARSFLKLALPIHEATGDTAFAARARENLAALDAQGA